MNVRLGTTDDVVHEVRSDGMTACGIMYATQEDLVAGLFSLEIATPVDHPIDCMTCWVGGRATMLARLQGSMSYVAMTFVIDPEPKK